MAAPKKKARKTAPPGPGWDVALARGAGKMVAKLPEIVVVVLEDLMLDLAEHGPNQPSWPNFTKLKHRKGQGASEGRYHCHLRKGRPTYVACWRAWRKTSKIEVYYAGTHEKAPY